MVRSFPLLPLPFPLTRNSDVISLTAVTIANIPAADFLRLLESEPLAGMRLSQLMARRLRQVNHRLIMRESNAISRVADTLLFLVEKQSKITGIRAEIVNLPHQDLADFCGLTRQTVTRIVNQIEAIGTIVRNRDSILIPDLQWLKKLLDSEDF